MNYQRIRYFLKAAETGSFSKAAKEMYVSSQALTKQIGLLEEELGGVLFERSSQGVKLTPLGMDARETFGRIDQELNRAVSDLRERAREDKKTMNIGFFSSLPQETIVTPLISYLLASFPDYRINLSLVELSEGRNMLMRGELDLLLTNTHEEDDWGESKCYCMEEHPAQVIVSLYHPWAMKQEITQEDMRTQPFLKMKMDMDHYVVNEQDSFYQNIPCEHVMEVSNFNTMYALLMQGKSFAVFPRAYSDMDKAKVKYFDYPGKTLIFHTAMLYNPTASHHKLDNAVREIVEEYEMWERNVQK